MSGGTIHDRLDALHVGLPGTVGAAVGVGHLDAEDNALVAEFTFGHFALPPRFEVHSNHGASTDIIPDTLSNCKDFF